MQAAPEQCDGRRPLEPSMYEVKELQEVNKRAPFSRVWQVKADKGSANLVRLQQASRGVNQATASVVASTKNGKAQIEDTGECAGSQATPGHGACPCSAQWNYLAQQC